MIAIRDGYSQTWAMDDPEPIAEDDRTEEIGDEIYEMEIRGGSALFIYDSDEEAIDIVGDHAAVRGARGEHWQEFGEYIGANNGVSETYEPDREIASDAAIEALEEFGVEIPQTEKPRIAADGGWIPEYDQEEYAQLGNEHFDGEDPAGYGPS
ncbi:MAG: hypothetical protein ABEK01_04785 [Candidatus Nanohaloarchaea archaeon]